jgi:hypothetical protein
MCIYLMSLITEFKNSIAMVNGRDRLNYPMPWTHGGRVFASDFNENLIYALTI